MYSQRRSSSYGEKSWHRCLSYRSDSDSFGNKFTCLQEPSLILTWADKSRNERRKFIECFKKNIANVPGVHMHIFYVSTSDAMLDIFQFTAQQNAFQNIPAHALTWAEKRGNLEFLTPDQKKRLVECLTKEQFDESTVNSLDVETLKTYGFEAQGIRIKILRTFGAMKFFKKKSIKVEFLLNLDL